jgi:small-conductance mechanosensitive channel
MRTGRLALALLALALAGAAGGEEPPSPTPAPAARTPRAEPATLTVGGRDVAVLRAILLGYSPKERARGAALRVKDALERGGGAISVRSALEGKLLEIGGHGVLLLSPEDADPLLGETFEDLVERARKALTVVVAEDHERHDTKRILVSAGEALVILAAAWGFLLVVVRIGRGIRRRLDRDLAARLEKVKLGGAEHIAREPLLVSLRFALQVLFFGMIVAVVLTALNGILTRFPVTRPLGERLTLILLDALAVVGTGILEGIPGLFVVVAIAVVTRLAVRAFDVFFRRVEAGALEVPWIDAELAPPTRRLVVAGLWIFALVMAYPYIPGSRSEAFKGVSVLLGLMISLGATGAVGQAASGLMLLYSRILRTGEWIRVGEHEGLVTSIGMFATRLRTGVGEEISLPNSVVVGTTTVNYSRAGAARGVLVETGVTIGYAEPWRQVEALLLLAADRTGDLLKDPKPFVLRTALSDFYVEYRLFAHSLHAAGRARVVDALHANILDAFNEFGVQILSPHYVGDPAQPAVVPRERWHASPAPAGDGPTKS